MQNQIGLSAEQIEGIAQWASSQKAVKALYVFGSRAKGSHSRQSDLDAAVRLDMDQAASLEAFDVFSVYWTMELEALTGLNVDLCLLAGNDTPINERAVADHGFLIYGRR